jgi:uncharacterized membrane protein YphA (DoxX/SURF4 family)
MSPNPFARFFLVLLRIAIGWHLAYEGLCKLDPRWQTLMRQTPDKEGKGYTEPFTAEGYLRNATGPLRKHFRELVTDVHGVRQMDSATLEEDWSRIVESAKFTYALRTDQSKSVEDAYKAAIEKGKAHLAGQQSKIERYKRELAEWQAADETDRYGARTDLHDRWKALETKRREIVGPLAALEKELRLAVSLTLDEQQRAAGGRALTFRDFTYLERLEQVNLSTKWGLTICGVLMIVGLFSQLAALGGAGFLALFYLSLPPWPGLPPVPGTEGNYLIVNKNLVEMLACLALACLPTGAWGGLDALVRGLIMRPLLGVGAREVVERTRRREDDDD